ncbi:MAG: extracellular solute-binding protein [Spirochaetes bacterium]|nr:extracellular solute-binding protein [Spirochaetota bacterium]
MKHYFKYLFILFYIFFSIISFSDVPEDEVKIIKLVLIPLEELDLRLLEKKISRKKIENFLNKNKEINHSVEELIQDPGFSKLVISQNKIFNEIRIFKEEYKKKLNINFEIKIVFLQWEKAVNEILNFSQSKIKKEGPIIVQLGSTWVPYFANMNMLEEVYFDGEKYFPQIVKICTKKTLFSSRYIAVPYNIGSILLFYRKDIIEKCMDHESVKKSFSNRNDFKILLERLKENIEAGKIDIDAPMATSTYDSFNTLHEFLPWLWGGGGDLIKLYDLQLITIRDVTLIDDKNINTINYIRSLIKNELVKIEPDGITRNIKFVKGNFAINLSGVWFIRQLIDKYPDDYFNRFGISLPPTSADKEHNNFTFLGGSALAILKGNYDKESLLISRELVTFLTGKESQKRFIFSTGNSPALKSVAIDEYKELLNEDCAEWVDVIINSMTEAGKTYPQIEEWLTAVENTENISSINTIWNSVIKKNYESKDIKAELKRFEKRLEKSLKYTPKKVLTFLGIVLFILILLVLIIGYYIKWFINRKKCKKVIITISCTTGFENRKEYNNEVIVLQESISRIDIISYPGIFKSKKLIFSSDDIKEKIKGVPPKDLLIYIAKKSMGQKIKNIKLHFIESILLPSFNINKKFDKRYRLSNFFSMNCIAPINTFFKEHVDIIKENIIFKQKLKNQDYQVYRLAKDIKIYLKYKKPITDLNLLIEKNEKELHLLKERIKWVEKQRIDILLWNKSIEILLNVVFTKIRNDKYFQKMLDNNIGKIKKNELTKKINALLKKILPSLTLSLINDIERNYFDNLKIIINDDINISQIYLTIEKYNLDMNIIKEKILSWIIVGIYYLNKNYEIKKIKYELQKIKSDIFNKKKELKKNNITNERNITKRETALPKFEELFPNFSFNSLFCRKINNSLKDLSDKNEFIEKICMTFDELCMRYKKDFSKNDKYIIKTFIEKNIKLINKGENVEMPKEVVQVLKKVKDASEQLIIELEFLNHKYDQYEKKS